MSDFDQWLSKEGPVALIIKEGLRPAAGKGAVIFPPTYAGDKEKTGSQSGYNIDCLKAGKRCTIDSVGSQANRLEPLFLHDPYRTLVPQITVSAGEKTVNLLEAAHRLGDASVRFSDKPKKGESLAGIEEDAQAAFEAFLTNGNAQPIARLSPTSIVFGVWDSRGTQAKLPRLLGSSIYANNVEVLSRSAQFIPSFDSEDVSNTSQEDLKDKDIKKWSIAGLAHAPSKGLGGVLVHGDIEREATVNLVALRHLRAENEEDTEKLQRYILSLILVAASLPQDYDLRSGCLLVRDGVDNFSATQVFRDGSEKPVVLNHHESLKQAQDAAEAFGVGADRQAEFSSSKAKAYLSKKK